MKEARSGSLEGIHFVNVKTGEKYKVAGGYYFADSERFTGFLRILNMQSDTLNVTDYLCCLKTGSTFQVVARPDNYTFVITGVSKEDSNKEMQQDTQASANAHNHTSAA